MATLHNIVLAVLVVWPFVVRAAFGSSYSLIMPTPYTNFFRKVSITMEVPNAPNPQENFLYIWPGIDLDSPLFQPVLANFETPSNYGCDASPGQWCLWLYVYESLTSFEEAPKIAVNPGDLLDMVIEYDDNDRGYAQSVTRGGRTISQLKGGAGGGQAHRTQTVVECVNNATGLTPAHTYTNLTMVLGATDAAFAQTVRQYYDNSTATELYTQDNGTSWKIDTIHVLSSNCNPDDEIPRTPSQVTSSSTPTPSSPNKASQGFKLAWWCYTVVSMTLLFSIPASL